MGLEHFCDGPKGFQSEPCTDRRFWTACDEELDMWDLIDVSGEHRKDSRRGVPVFAFVEGVDDDEGLNAGSLERTDNNFLQLVTKSVSFDLGVGLQDREQLLSELWVPVSKLECEGREDVLDISPVLGISRTEETRTELPVRKASLGECLGDGRLPGPRETIKPEDTLVPLIH